MGFQRERAAFERAAKVGESARLTFLGVEGFDVYNTSVPFAWRGGSYLFGRVERRSEWARSWVRLFRRVAQDVWALVPGSMIYQLEDPFVCQVGGELVMGGTHVRCRAGAIDTFYGYFYRGADLHDLTYFTTGPDRMKDIRLVQLADGRVGVFSRPRGEEVRRQTGAESQVGFTVIDTLDELTAEVVAAARPIAGLFAEGEWGGCNQALLLEGGDVGVIGHKSYTGVGPDGAELLSYVNVSFVFSPEAHEARDMRVIGTRPCYPAGPAKRPELADCAFTSGIAPRADGRVDLYSGIGDTQEGRVVIDDPFAGRVVGW